MTLQNRKTYSERAGTWQVTLPIPSGMYGLPGPNGTGKSRIPATLQAPDGGSVRLGDTDETVCVLDAVTPAKRHRAQQFTGGKNTGVPATLARNALWEVTNPVNLTGTPNRGTADRGGNLFQLRCRLIVPYFRGRRVTGVIRLLDGRAVVAS